MKQGKVTTSDIDYGKALGTSAAVKVAFAILGIGVTAGMALVIGMDQLMKRIFVNDAWPEEEWSNNDWAEEDLE